MSTSDSLDIREAEQILKNLTAGGFLPVSPDSLANQAAAAYLYSTGHNRPGEPVFLDLLCRLAVSDSRTVAAIAVATLYRKLVEGFCDDFTISGTLHANCVLAHLIGFTRNIDRNSTMDQRLGRLGLHSDAELLNRWQKITTAAPITSEEKMKIRRIIIPSRVSAGADIVITSVMVHRLLTSFPNAEITLLGPIHIAEVFHDVPRVTHQLFEVRRHGSLMDRILFWPRLEECIRIITDGLKHDEAMIFDPDSRLSQLGLLPLAAKFKTCHFPSRSMSPDDDKSSLSELTNQWLDLLLGPEEHIFPRISLGAAKRSAADSFLGLLRQNGCKHLTVANFGVGGDERKQVVEPFEERVIERLLTKENSIIILDMGCGAEEKSRTEKLMANASRGGTATAITNDHEMAGFNPGFRHGIVGTCTSIGSLAALIAGADCYVGYDSSGQHLAAAVATPAVSIFAGYPNARFLNRWSPANSGGINTVLAVPDPAPKFLAAIDELADRTASAVNNYL